MVIAPEVWFPVVTLVIGVVLKVGADFLTDRRAERRESSARLASHRNAVSERRVQFQRENLLELQDFAARVVRCSARIHFEDRDLEVKHGAWGKGTLSSELNEEALKANQRFTLLMVRIDDEEVRHLSDLLGAHYEAISTARSATDSAIELRSAGETYERLQQRIGEVLRELDQAPC